MAGQDIKKRLLPGQSQPVNVGGDFIFLKFADRPVSILINDGDSAGSRVTMEPGDKYRPGSFESFEVENTDQQRPAQIILTVGRGDYNRQIVKGEIQVIPSLRASDGTLKPDTRQEITLNLVPGKTEIIQRTRGDVLYGVTEQSIAKNYSGTVSNFNTGDSVAYGKNGLFWVCARANDKLSLIGMDKEFVIKETITVANGWTFEEKPQSLCWNGYEFIALFYVGYQQYEIRRIGKSFVSSAVAKVDGVTAKHIRFNRTTKNYVVTINNSKTVILLNGELEEIERKSIQLTEGVIWDMAADLSTGNWVVAGSFKTAEIEQNTLEVIEEWDVWVKMDAGFVVAGNFIWRSNRDAGKMEKLAAQNHQEGPTFGAIPEAGRVAYALLKRPEWKTNAAIEIKEVENGLWVTGQLIKAALESYFGKPVKGDYLDSVYKVDMGRGLDGFPQKVTVTGTNTFKTAGVADLFGVFVPGEITITVDDELTLGDPIEL